MGHDLMGIWVNDLPSGKLTQTLKITIFQCKVIFQPYLPGSMLIYWRVKLRPGPACCPEVYRDVPGKFHDDDDDDDDDDD